MSEDRVSLEDREHAKRIVYSVVYGAGKLLIIRAHHHFNLQSTIYIIYHEFYHAFKAAVLVT